MALAYPSRDSFYRGVGVEYAIDKYETAVNISSFKPNEGKNAYSIKDKSMYGETLRRDYEEINKWLWENSRYNEMKWPACYEGIKFMCSDICIAMAYDKHGRPRGCMLYELANNNIYVISIRFTCLDVLIALKDHILAMSGLNYCKFISMPPDFPLEAPVKEMGRPEEAIILKRHNTRMARVINFGALLEKMIVTSEESKLTENFAAMDITDAAPLLCGMTSAEELYYGGRLIISNSQNISQSRHNLPEVVRKLSKMLPKEITFNADEYLAP